MTQHRVFFAALAAAFILSACSGGSDEMKTEGEAAEATTEQAVDATQEAAETMTEDKAADASTETDQSTQTTTTN